MGGFDEEVFGGDDVDCRDDLWLMNDDLGYVLHRGMAKLSDSGGFAEDRRRQATTEVDGVVDERAALEEVVLREGTAVSGVTDELTTDSP